MPRKHHNLQFRHLALRVLDTNDGDIARTARQCDVSVRTLRRWRAQRAAGKLAPLPATIDPEAALESDIQSLHYVRRQIIQHLMTLASELTAGLETASLPERAITFSRLLDRFERLDRYLPSPEHGPMLVVFTPDDEEIGELIHSELTDTGNLARFGIDLTRYNIYSQEGQNTADIKK